MKRFLIAAATALAFLPAHAQIVYETVTDKVPWIGELPAEIGKDYRFIILPDRKGGPDRGVLSKAVDEMNALSPDFIINVGDLIDGYVSDLSYSSAQWDEAIGLVKRLNAPLFLVGGNHDLSNKMMSDDWISRFGRAYYHFTVGDDLFLVLNTEEFGNGNLSQEQVSYFRDLIQSFKGRWIYVFMHRSLWIKNSGGYGDIDALLQGRGHTVISGHEHAYYMEEREGMKYIQVATIDGSSWMRGMHVGEFDHYLYVTARADGPVIANMVPGGQVRLDLVSPRNRSYVNTLTGRSHIQLSSVMLDGPLQENFTAELAVTNPNDSDMKFTLETPGIDGFEFSLKKEECTVKPHETLSFPIVITNLNRIPAASFPCMKLKTTCGYMMDGEMVELPSYHQFFFDWPHKVPESIDCKVPDYVKEDWDWHSIDDGWFSFSISTRRNKLVIAAAMHDDIRISPDPEDPSKPFDKIVMTLQSGGKDYSWTLTSDGEVTLPLGKIRNRAFLFNISYTDSDEVRNIKPSVLWWRRKPVQFSL